MTLSGTYVLRRVLIALPSLLGISLVLFTVLALAPGDPFGDIVSNPNIPAEVAANLRIKFGMDDPVMVRYFRWLFAMLHGDWGFSFASRIDWCSRFSSIGYRLYIAPTSRRPAGIFTGITSSKRSCR